MNSVRRVIDTVREARKAYGEWCDLERRRHQLGTLIQTIQQPWCEVFVMDAVFEATQLLPEFCAIICAFHAPHQQEEVNDSWQGGDDDDDDSSWSIHRSGCFCAPATTSSVMIQFNGYDILRDAPSHELVPGVFVLGTSPLFLIHSTNSNSSRSYKFWWTDDRLPAQQEVPQDVVAFLETELYRERNRNAIPHFQTTLFLPEDNSGSDDE
jgi:hypothetical protein